MKTIEVIPSRYQSSRFSGKPFADLCGNPMIWWIYGHEYLTIMSYNGSARKHGINAFTAIRKALNGNSDTIFN